MRKIKWALFSLNLVAAWAATLTAFNWTSVVSDTRQAGWVFLGMSLFHQTMAVLISAVAEARGREAAQHSASSQA